MAAAAPAAAQMASVGAAGPERDGVWFNVGLGWGSLGCQDCGSREGGLSGGLGLGGWVSEKVALGVGTNGWTKEESGARLTAGTITAMLRFYPSETGGFFLQGGLGYGTVDLSISGVGSASTNGAGAMLGLGYDIPVSSNASLTPFWNGVGIQNDDGDANFGQIGIGLTIY